MGLKSIVGSHYINSRDSPHDGDDRAIEWIKNLMRMLFQSLSWIFIEGFVVIKKC